MPTSTANDIRAAFVLEDNASAVLKQIDDTSAKTSRDMQSHGERAGRGYEKLTHVLQHTALGFLGLRTGLSLVHKAAEELIGRDPFEIIVESIANAEIKLGLWGDEAIEIMKRAEEAAKHVGEKFAIQKPSKDTLFTWLNQALYGGGDFGAGILAGIKDADKEVANMALGIADAGLARKVFEQLRPAYALLEQLKRDAGTGIGTPNVLPEELAAITSKLDALRAKLLENATGWSKWQEGAKAARETLSQLEQTDPQKLFHAFGSDAAETASGSFYDMKKAMEEFGLTEKEAFKVLDDAKLDAKFTEFKNQIQAANRELRLSPVFIEGIIKKAEELIHKEEKAVEKTKTFAEGWKEATKDVGDAAKIAGEIASTLKTTIADALDNIIWKTKSWRDFLSDALRSFSHIAFNQGGGWITSLFGSLFGGGGGSSGSGPSGGGYQTLGSPVPGGEGLFGGYQFFGSAHGNVFSGGNLVPFARGGVITQPVIFPMARGAGLAGEAGPEAIMPLKRTRGGDLGVAVAGGGGGGDTHVHLHIGFVDTRGADEWLARKADYLATLVANQVNHNAGLKRAIRAA